MKLITLFLFLTIFLSFLACSASQIMWKPSNGPLMTKWVEEIDYEMPFPEYPRPQMMRNEWLNLIEVLPQVDFIFIN